MAPTIEIESPLCGEGGSVIIQRCVAPAVVLLLLAPMIAELLTSASPPAEFFSPFLGVGFVGLYGSGAVICRELTHRWNQGWPTLLLLGLAFGMIQEGLVVKSFFNPDYPDAATAFGDYGRWGGANWLWAQNTSFFHAAISTGVPVILVSLLFPERRDEPWLTGRELGLLFILFATDVFWGCFVVASYHPAPVLYMVTLSGIAGLGVLGRHIRHPLFPSEFAEPPPARPVWFFLTGLVGVVLFYLAPALIAGVKVHFLLTMLASLVLVASLGALLVKLSRNGTGFSPPHQFALAGGALTPYIMMAPVWEFALPQTRTDDTRGMTCVAVAALALLALVLLRLRQTEGSNPT